jgi:hypothetical protein
MQNQYVYDAHMKHGCADRYYHTRMLLLLKVCIITARVHYYEIEQHDAYMHY